jgi:uncharacterized protein (TIGR03437 family)
MPLLSRAVIACKSLILLIAIAAATSLTARAQSVITLIGTGSDAGIAFQFVTPVPLTSSSTGLTTVFTFISCTLPAGESCIDVDYSPGSGVIRLRGTITIHTWAFPEYLHNGVFPSTSVPGGETGLLFVSGIDATSGTPQAIALGAAFAFPLEATVTDINFQYQSGASVTFTAPGSGPSAILPGGGVVTTDSSGRARITPTANGVAGAYQINASAFVGGQSVAYSFVAANVNTANASGSCQVTTASDDFSSGSLRNLIATCGRGGTITFASGITPQVSYQDIPLIQDLTIDGGSGGTTIECSATRLFFMTGGTVTLKNLTIDGCSANGGFGGGGAVGGGGGAGMGGAVFQNGGSLIVNNVTFSNDFANGGMGGAGSTTVGLGWGGGGGDASNGGSAIFTSSAGNGGGGGPFGGSGGSGSATTAGASGSGIGAGGGAGKPAGNGGFGGGGGAAGAASTSGNGGFGGGAGGSLGALGAAGTYGGSTTGSSGGGGAGLGGAIYVNAGTLSLTNTTFLFDAAQPGQGGGSGAGDGKAKGGALYISQGATAAYTGAAPTFGGNAAQDAGSGTPCSATTGAGALDTQDVCGILQSANANHFQVTASATATAGAPVSVTVTALNALNQTDAGYAGTIHFTSTDASATLPADYTFVVGDAGVHTFTNGAVLRTAGARTITAKDTVTNSITGTSSNITVSAGAVNSIAVTAPSTAVAGVAFNFTVTLKDIFNNSIASSPDTLHFTSTDTAAALPADQAFSSGTFSAILNTKGAQTITAKDTAVNVSGTSGNLSLTVAATPNSNGSVIPPAINLIDYVAGGGTSILSSAFHVSFSDGKGFTVGGGAPWLNVAVNGNTVNVSVNPAGVTRTFTSSINLTFTFGDGTTQTGQVTLQAIEPAQFVIPTGITSLAFTAPQASGPQSQPITIAAAGFNIPAQAVAATATGGPWLTVTGGGTTPQPFTVTANPMGLTPGTYSGAITITSTAAGTNPLVIPVALIVTSTLATVTINSFVNAASMRTASAAPNEILTVFGTFPNCNSNAQVTVNGSAASVFFSSPAQINFLMPEITTGANAIVQVQCPGGLPSAPQTIQTTGVNPALFTVSQNGTGPADSVNQDNSVNAPVPVGTVVQLYGTGFGSYAPVSPDGLTRLAQPVTASVAGQPAQVLFAGQAPGYTPGLQQIDVLIPANAQPGPGASLSLTIGGVTTQTGVTLNLAAPAAMR